MTKQMDPTRRKQARHAQKAKMKRRRRQTGLIVTAVILAVAAAAGWSPARPGPWRRNLP